MQIVSEYLKNNDINSIDSSSIAYIANLETVKKVSPNISKAIVKELEDQRSNLKLIASENYCSLPVQLAMGNLLTDKYAEGFTNHRFYAGCDNVDFIESLACEEACKLFGAEHAYVQPHSGADANMIAYWAILRTKVQVPELQKLGEENPVNLSKKDWDDLRAITNNQKLLGLDLSSGGHLTHGYRHNVSAQMFDVYSYSVDRETKMFDYSELRKRAKEVKPLIFMAGFSAYSRNIDYSILKEIADEVGAVLMVDMAHFAGLVAGGVLQGVYNPVQYADVVTSTTHKTLRGPRGGLVLCKKEYAESVDKGCPLVIGGPLPHVLAAKQIAFKEANTQEFKDYAHKIVENSSYLAEVLMENGLDVVTGGTENHIILVDLNKFGLTGRQGESALRECSFTLNRNTVPFDPNGPWYTSGIRLGTAAITTLGMGKPEMKELASIIKDVLQNTVPATIASGKNAGKKSKSNYILDTEAKNRAKQAVKDMLDKFPLYPQLDLEFLKKHFVEE